MTLYATPLALDVKAVAEDGTFEGYASVFDVADLGRDVVKPGAFRRSLAGRGAAKVKMLRQHRPDEPIGVWTDLREDAKGLRATGRLVLDTVAGRETHALMKAGALDGLSIGYRTRRHSIDQAKGLRLLHDVELVEISVVTFPMNAAATVSAVKNLHPAERAHEIAAAIHRARAALLST